MAKEEIKDQEILSLLQNLIKQRKDSIDSFKIANRQDLIEKEQSEKPIKKMKAKAKKVGDNLKKKEVKKKPLTTKKK